ncbi:MAG: YkgJ family cysteine cluster protein [Myxococcota bacterium]|nr:YkgJ family cysteine cluster protein [Myxococcota bacterium]
MSNPYDELKQRVGAFHDRVSERHPGALTCHSGCSSCCERHLSVMTLEWAPMAEAIDDLDEDEKTAIRARLEAGRADPRCPLLNDAGRCRVYDARPMICRSHGLPIQVGEPPKRDVCPLNFPEGPSVETLDPEVVLDVNRLNATVGLISQLTGLPPEDRVDLFDGLEALLGEPG